MADLNQIRVSWTGLTGMPGVSTFYNQGDPAVLLAKLRTFYDAVKGSVPSGITWKFPTNGVVIDSATGQAKAGWTAPSRLDVLSTATGSFAPPVGFCVNWGTGLFVHGRNVRGRTFVVPITSSNFGSDGKLTPGSLASYQAAASALAGGTNGLEIYSRRNGVSAAALTGNVPNMAAVLRSRRD